MKKKRKRDIIIASIFCCIIFFGLCMAAKRMIKKEAADLEQEPMATQGSLPDNPKGPDNIGESGKSDPTTPPTPIPTATLIPTTPPTPISTATPIPTATLIPTATPIPTSVPTPDIFNSENRVTPEPSPTLPEENKTKEDETSNHKIVAIDPGHQAKGNSEKEPLGPGSSVKKAKVSSGTTGVATKVAEYELNLDISLALRDELEDRGYTVVMIRETHDVNLSNKERADIANEQADIFVRIHANGSENQAVSGALTIYPSKDNEFVGSMSGECKKLAEAIISKFCEATGAKNRGAVIMDNMSGINWCTIPVTIVEMGYMSNPEEDKRMQEPDYQKKMVQGIADGIDLYFQEK